MNSVSQKLAAEYLFIGRPRDLSYLATKYFLDVAEVEELLGVKHQDGTEAEPGPSAHHSSENAIIVEAQETLKELLNSDNERIRLDAAKRLIDEEKGRLDNKTQVVEVKDSRIASQQWFQDINKALGDFRSKNPIKMLPPIIDVPKQLT